MSKSTKKYTVKKLEVIIEANNGNVYQVYLNDYERLCIKDLLAQLHKGEIKVIGDILDIDIIKKKGGKHK